MDLGRGVGDGVVLALGLACHRGMVARSGRGADLRIEGVFKKLLRLAGGAGSAQGCRNRAQRRSSLSALIWLQSFVQCACLPAHPACLCPLPPHCCRICE
jgi:hypothetical protein